MEKSRTRTLVAYGSKLGSTAEVAKFIGSVLTEQGAEIEVKPVSGVDDLDVYDNVILGSAIRYDRWLPDATTFVKENKATLSNVPVSFFFTCITLAKPTPAALIKAEGYADKLRSLAPEVKPMAVGGFAGVLQFARTPWPARLALRMLSIATGVKQGDDRDWEAIRFWTLSQLEPHGHFRKEDVA
ncbi:MAG: flavodoxin domain-containing protein [Pseudomonadota bacterium]